MTQEGWIEMLFNCQSEAMQDGLLCEQKTRFHNATISQLITTVSAEYMAHCKHVSDIQV